MNSEPQRVSRNPFSKRGQCGKNALPKRGLTPEETRRVNMINAADKERWKHLLSLNKWKPQK